MTLPLRGHGPCHPLCGAASLRVWFEHHDAARVLAKHASPASACETPHERRVVPSTSEKELEASRDGRPLLGIGCLEGDPAVQSGRGVLLESRVECDPPRHCRVVPEQRRRARIVCQDPSTRMLSGIVGRGADLSERRQTLKGG